MNRNNEKYGFDSRDWTISGIAISIFLIALALFIFDTVRVETSDREIVGTIIYRNRVAQKRYSNSVIWQDVEQKEEVRNLDSIRTDERAEAILLLHRGTRIELDPLSMIVINIQDDESKIILERGSIFVDPNEKDMVKVQKGKKSLLNFTSLLRIFGDDSDRILVFSEGKVTLEESGKSIAIKPNTITQVDETISEKGETLKLIDPPDNARYFVGKGEELNIPFRWNNPSNEKMKLILGKDPFFKKMINTYSVQGDGYSIKLPSGNYYWKLEGSRESSIPRRIRIKTRSKLAIFAPIHQEKLYIEESDLIAFQWNEIESLDKFVLEISKDEKFETIIKSPESKRNGISVKLDTGQYFVRVKGIGVIPGVETVSSALEFMVLDANNEQLSESSNKNKLENEIIKNLEKTDKEGDITDQGTTNYKRLKPIPIYPKSTIDMAGKNKLVFRWKGIPNIEEYEFILKEEKSGGNILIQKNIKDNKFALKDLTILDIGLYSWEIKAIDHTSGAVKTNFRIILSEDLEAPELDF